MSLKKSFSQCLLSSINCPVCAIDIYSQIKSANNEFLKHFKVEFNDSLLSFMLLANTKSFSDTVTTLFNEGTPPTPEHQKSICLIDRNHQEKHYLVSFGKGCEGCEKCNKIPADTETPLLLCVLQDISNLKYTEALLAQRDYHISFENVHLKQNIKKMGAQTEIIGESDSIKTLFKKIGEAANTSVPILIEGESGTGKELVAKKIHKMSNRWKKDFVVVNCSAVPEHLAESMFFGHKKGAFTGAYADYVGVIKEAEKGTLFLDEVNSIPLSLQPKLLRILENREITPLGSNKVEKVDFRLICATNKPLHEYVEQKLLRDDFYYRIKVLTINLPPLREHKEDIPLLAKHFFDLYKYRHTYDSSMKEISKDILDQLEQYSYPGNVRELKNILYRYFAVGRLDLENFFDIPQKEQHIDLDTQQVDSITDIILGSLKTNVSLSELTDQVEKTYLSQLLIQEKFNKTKVAKILNVGRKTLYLKAKKHGLD